ncbi:MAG TPA: MBL fold metallo-hydrolase [Gammaproteobacteria bacterium]|jgi:glyoxylase-like metal-dependent hydrolase (beta-lactamase superfamily II)
MSRLPPTTYFGHGITAVDTDYVRPRLDASHVIVRDRRAAFVDTGTTHSVPNLLIGLVSAGALPDQVDWVFLTHIHLDHAGGAGELMKHLPNAKLVVHPRGAAHMVDPTKLIEGTKAVYGEAEFARLYGEIPGIPAERVVQATDGMKLNLGESEFELIHTPGHALHHYCIVDRDSESVFTGDTFGISYRIFDTAKGPFIFPATTPVHFDPVQAHASLDRIMGHRPKQAFLTHYSRVGNPEILVKDMHEGIDAHVRIAESVKSSGEERLRELKQKTHAWLVQRVRAHGCTLDQAIVDTWLEMDVDLNAKGLAVWLDRKKS